MKGARFSSVLLLLFLFVVVVLPVLFFLRALS